MSEETAVARREDNGAIQKADEWSAPMSIEELLHRVHLVEEVKRRVMHEGEHYGVIPGTPKPTLYQPGAQKLGMTFQLHPTYEIDERDLGRGHREYRVCCNLHNSAGGLVSSCWASCSTLESRYRYRKAERTCPECGAPAIIKGKPEYGGGYVCFKKKDGCGAKFQTGDPAIEDQAEGRAEHDNPADYYNTCLKMGQKRAYVGAVINATGGSDLFTQDVEDSPEAFGARPPNTPPPEPASDKQVELVQKMMQSHVITDKERQGIQSRIDAGMSKKQASDAIEWLQTETAARKEAEGEQSADPTSSKARPRSDTQSTTTGTGSTSEPAETGSGALPFDDVDANAAEPDQGAQEPGEPSEAPAGASQGTGGADLFANAPEGDPFPTVEGIREKAKNGKIAKTWLESEALDISNKERAVDDLTGDERAELLYRLDEAIAKKGGKS